MPTNKVLLELSHAHSVVLSSGWYGVSPALQHCGIAHNASSACITHRAPLHSSQALYREGAQPSEDLAHAGRGSFSKMTLRRQCGQEVQALDHLCLSIGGRRSDQIPPPQAAQSRNCGVYMA